MIIKRHFTKRPLRGLGDAVALVAQPIARGIDAVLRTNVAGCVGCYTRQEKLNAAVPFNGSKKAG